MQWKEFRSHLSYLSSMDQARVEKAFMMAQEAHEGQKRRSGEPYFTHPLAVAGILAGLHGDTETIIAALLHDAVEDTPVTLEDIDKAFNGNVRTLIDGVTKLSKADMGEVPTLDEQIETLRKMFTLMEQDIRIMVIKLVDRLHNMQTAEFLSPERQKTLAEETMDVYVKIADRLSMQDVRDELEALCLVILDPENFAALQKLRIENDIMGKKLVHKVQRAIHDVKALGGDTHVVFEASTWKRLSEQQSNDGSEQGGQIPYVLAIVASHLDDCYRILGILHQKWQREILSFQDFINSPTINGYRGLHTTIILEDGTRVRCKIRTTEMQEYAHNGIAKLCFQLDKESFLKQLPWTKHISTLALDTSGRSQEFWQSLQSDILGESIIVHGPADEAILIPTDSTALDGAFYCLQEEALRVEKIFMNGKEIPFSAKLHNAASLDFRLHKEHTVNREWLGWVHTGFALAQIRSGLGQESEHKKISTGKALLQKALFAQHHAFIEEFSDATLKEALAAIHQESLSETYIAIANGHLDPLEFSSKITVKKENGSASRTHTYVVRYTVNLDDLETMLQVNTVNKEFRPYISEIRYRYWPGRAIGTVRMHIDLSEENMAALVRKMEAAGAKEVTAVTSHKYPQYLIGIVIVFWALNPVIARWLLRELTPASLLTIRLIASGCFAFFFYAIWRVTQGKRLSAIPHVHRLAIIPAITTIALAWFTYSALEIVPPSLHLTIMRFNVLLLPLGYYIVKKQFRGSIALSAIVLLAAIQWYWFPLVGMLFQGGMIFSLLALLTYVFYSSLMEVILQKSKIGIRYPSFLASIGLFLGFAGIGMAFLQPYTALWNALTIPTLLYVLFCVFLPHTCFHLALEKMPFRNVTDIFLLEVPLAILFESLLLGIVLNTWLYAGMSCALGIIMLVRWKNLNVAAKIDS